MWWGWEVGYARRLWAALVWVLVVVSTALAPVSVLGEGRGIVEAAVPHGKADVYTTPAQVSVLSGDPGTTFALSIVVEPSGINVEAASVAVAFDPRFLAVDAAGVAPGGPLTTELQRVIDNSQGLLYFAAGKLGGPWPDTAFTLATVTFRFVASPIGPLTVTPVQGARTTTDVASYGVSVLNAVRGSTVTVGPPPSSQGSSTSSGGSSRSSSTGGSSTSSASSGGSTAASPRISAPAVVPPAATVLPLLPAAAPATTGAAPPAPPAARVLPPGVLPPIPAWVQVGAAPVAAPFAQFYAERQGLRVLGNTLGPPLGLNGITAQYFEKGRAEDHPEEQNPLWRVQYGLLVDELVGARSTLPVGGDASTLTYAAIQQLADPSQRVAPPPGFVGGTMFLPDGSVFVPFSAALVPEAGHVVPPNFWAYVNNLDLFPGGWLHDIGLPITEPVEAVVDKGPATGRQIVVQAFQRTVLTYDPLNPPDYWVERANVGTDYARAFPDKFADQPTQGGT